MLAPANHGSALAQLGKSRLGRIKSFFDGVEPGERILDWLELGSDEGWELNENWVGFDCPREGLYPFVLVGQTIDRSLYDALNSYTGEPGSDGVVRVAAANMNYSLLRLVQSADGGLMPEEVLRPRPTAFGVLPGRSHSGESKGIIRSVTMANADTHPTAQWVLRCLRVNSLPDYDSVSADMAKLTAETQAAERTETVSTLIGHRTYITNRHSMLIFKFVDDRGNSVPDYDLFLTAGPKYDEQELPQGFCVDRQQNQCNPGTLTYYLDYDVMTAGLTTPAMEGKIGLRVNARPGPSDTALAFYRPLNYQSSLAAINKIMLPNETTMIEIKLLRRVDKTVFRLTNDLTPSAIDATPTNQTVD
jgi:hypothetical protein